jgi:hypothetical protein
MNWKGRRYSCVIFYSSVEVTSMIKNVQQYSFEKIKELNAVNSLATLSQLADSCLRNNVILNARRF